MADAWAQPGSPRSPRRCRALAATARARRSGSAVRASQRRLPDGSLFIPVRLLDGEQPYASLTRGAAGQLLEPRRCRTRSRPGSSRPGAAEATRRARATCSCTARACSGSSARARYALYGRDAPFPVSGTDQVYGINVARFLADNDQADQLVLSLYGQLAAAMTPGTFVAGEAASVAPLARRALPRDVPAAERRAQRRVPRDAAADARARDAGRARARVRDAARVARRGEADRRRDAPTSFGPLSFSLAATAGAVSAAVDVPDRTPRARSRSASGCPGRADRRRHARRPALVAASTGRPARSTSPASPATWTSLPACHGLAQRINLVTLAAARNTLAAAPRAFAAFVDRSDRSRARPTATKPAGAHDLTIHYRAHDGVRRRAYILLPSWYGPKQQPADPARHLAARARRQRAREHEALGRAAGARPVRGDQPRRRGPQAEALLVGLGRADRGPGADAGDRAAHAPLAARRQRTASTRSAAAWAARRRCSCSPAIRGCSPARPRSTPSRTLRCQYRSFRSIPCNRACRQHVARADRAQPAVPRPPGDRWIAR